MSIAARASVGAAVGAPVVPHFQPIVELATRTIIGYESLARWPDHPDVSPLAVFEEARHTGHLADLDYRCRRASVREALRAGITSPLSVFINAEPTVLRSMPELSWTAERLSRLADSGLQVVIELTERDLLADPAMVLATAEWARANRCGIALDDVGSNPDSLALLPLICPDVVKLDRSLLSWPLSDELDATVAYVLEYAITSGARVLAEGIETEAEAARASALGATLGQGYLFGRPAPALEQTVASRDVPALRFLDPAEPAPAMPIDVLDALPRQVATHATIARVVDSISELVGRTHMPGCVLVGLQHPEVLSTRRERFYKHFADGHTLVGVLGAPDFCPLGIRHGTAPDLPFFDQFAMVVMNPRYCAAVVARDLGDAGPLPECRYEWAFTHRRNLVRNVANSLVRHLAPRPDIVGVDEPVAPVPPARAPHR